MPVVNQKSETGPFATRFIKVTQQESNQHKQSSGAYGKPF